MIEVSSSANQTKGKRLLLDIIVYDNKLLIKNLSRTTPMDYRCIADNGIPPRDTRTKRLIPSSNCYINENSRKKKNNTRAKLIRLLSQHTRTQ